MNDCLLNGKTETEAPVSRLVDEDQEPEPEPDSTCPLCDGEGVVGTGKFFGWIAFVMIAVTYFILVGAFLARR